MLKINIKELPYLMPSNINWPKFFLNNNPIDLEIGCGRTHFFFDRAYHFPNRNIIGIEWKYDFIYQGHKRIIRENINNAALFHGNAWLLVPTLFQQKTVSQIFINFPDPWWKEKHKKRLLLNDTFIDILIFILKKDGFIYINTDVKDLFNYYKEKLKNHGMLLDDIILKDIDQINAKSHREKKCLTNNLFIYKGIFINNI